MNLKSIKFGGTSMGNATSIIECAKIVKSKIKDYNIVVTVSAVAGITDKLIEIIRFARNGKPRLVKSKVIEICNIHKQILKNLLLNDEYVDNLWEHKFEPIINKLEAISYGTSLVGDLTDKTVARICAFGEKLSSLLMVLALEKLNIKSQRIESERIIKTDNNYLKAKVNFQATNLSTKKILKQIYSKNIVPVVTGFIGKDTHGNITLLGRGGSDYTASILAMVLNASEIEIWTDVNGIMTADPRIVKDAFSWSSLDMNVMSEMAYSGAKVIHPDTIALAVEKNIPVYVYNTFDRSFKGTKITKKAPYAKGIVASLNNTIITLENTSIINGVGFVKRVTEIVAEHNIPIDVCATSEISFTFSIKTEDYSKKLLKILESFAFVKVKDKVAKLCFIGNEITYDKKILAGIFNVCMENDTKIYTISVSASGNNITIIIDESKTDLILKCLHKKFLKKEECCQ
ncbi:aspartate kinase [Rickettsiales endosymbiont of Trichoplax sp. H2]|uniref:aspartate kinase n=1 Tax=Rickettsiales endosymbiont of Trichoplax sp. H2 TaxID=2021221 RepID=UPI0012B43689|nr:aspartate kinase [Rickettsiales endosymbiont of Trichoplax sp. H2]MSO14289.1 putative aspartokinase [Rickettsiales endosymbiont of Trichoplax sp. H2]